MSTFEPRTGHRYGRASKAILYMLFGPIVWAGHLTLIYGAHTLICARSPDGPAWAATIVYSITAVGLAILVAAMALAVSRRRAAHAASDTVQQFEHDVMGLMTLLSIFGVAWSGLTAVFITACTSLR